MIEEISRDVFDLFVDFRKNISNRVEEGEQATTYIESRVNGDTQMVVYKGKLSGRVSLIYSDADGEVDYVRTFKVVS